MSYLPAMYQPSWNYGNASQQAFPQFQQNVQPQSPQQAHGMIWVDGEVGAKAYQMPQNWPANQPIPLWDTNDTVIYLKSVNPMGMPNPLQKAHYTLEGMQSGEKRQGYSGSEQTPDISEYVRKEDLDRMKQDLIDTIGQMNTSGTGTKRPAKGE